MGVTGSLPKSETQEGGSAFRPDPSRKVIIDLGDSIPLGSIRDDDPKFSSDRQREEIYSQEQQDIQAEINPLVLKDAIKKDEVKRKFRRMVVDSLEVDFIWGCVAAGMVGVFAVPVSKYAVNHAAIHQPLYAETKVGTNTSVFTAAPSSSSKLSPKQQIASEAARAAGANKQLGAGGGVAERSLLVGGSTFQSLFSSPRYMLEVGNALEKMRAQQLRLGFFSLWRGTGAEIFWFVTSGAASLSAQASIDRVLNKPWYERLKKGIWLNKMGKVKEQEDEIYSELQMSSSVSTSPSLAEEERKWKKEKEEEKQQQEEKDSSNNNNIAAEGKSTEKKKPQNSSQEEEEEKDKLGKKKQQLKAEKQKEDADLKKQEAKEIPLQLVMPKNGDRRIREHDDHVLHSLLRAKNCFLQGFVSGSIGGALAVFATYHAEIVATKCVEDYQTSMRTGAKRQYTSMIDCYFKTQQQSGLSSLYFGVGPVFFRAAAFWGLTFGIRNAFIELCGYTMPNDFVRILKRQYYELPAVDDSYIPPIWREKYGSASSSADLKKNRKNKKKKKKNKEYLEKAEEEQRRKDLEHGAAGKLSGIKKTHYAGLDFFLVPLFFNFAFGTAAAAIARDAGPSLVRGAVTVRAGTSFLFWHLYAFTLKKEKELGKVPLAADGSVSKTTPEEVQQALKSAKVSNKFRRATNLFSEAFRYGRSAASGVPKRLPFSCVRTGILMALFDSMRQNHTVYWCN